jgi:hypothetical protein
VEGGIQPLKVSKPILIALILAILFAVYMLLFTGKKRPAFQPPPSAATTGSDTQPGQPAPMAKLPKPALDATSLAWKDDPFFLPRSVTDRKPDKPKAVLKLVAIMEGKTGRYAIIGGDIVKRGDIIGDEKVAEIHRDKVVLIRNNAKRTLSIEDTMQ